MQHRPTKLLATLLTTFLLFACGSSNKINSVAWASYDHVDTANLNELEDLKQERLTAEEAEKEVNPIRLEGLKEAAMTVGAQGALALRSQQINKLLIQGSSNLDQIFNFQALVLKDDVLPPVLVDGRGTYNLADDNTVRIADQTYLIVQQARFVTAPPHWRNYLWFDFHKPDVPDPTLLPRPNIEQEIKTWRTHVRKGWEHGLDQANAIFAENLARLKRDYEGMALYRKLLDENMISAPVVAKTELGITGGGNEMSVNDRFKRITAHPSLNTSGEEWTPAVSQEYTSVADAARVPRYAYPANTDSNYVK